ncbi:Intracellular chorismate mutase [Streptomyces sp. RB5]|uniref:Intracellular chorismate mutase n=1 Tax=Streptomyces smaragdinus TaxID=2585196 RepID=A0A7K0CP05_9ACTN|nr:chorismate mutase [Streptomyces smaragdinus]MQY15220.1 Intracellular chorismate mutase [Streptomyces smaragdinus]
MFVQEEEAVSDVTTLRAGIDLIDVEIRALIERRRELSAGVQRARLAAGGTRTDLSREGRIISSYADAYGRQGTAIAMALLETCRGTAAR